MDEVLIETLRDAQRFGFFGKRPVEASIAHALDFVRAVDRDDGARIVDLGSGGGLPGLVIAHELRGSTIVLIDRREKRTDFLRRAVARLHYEHVEVRAGDVKELVREVAAGVTPGFDVATARGFGPPEDTLLLGLELIVPTGCVVISEPPTGDRWPADLLTDLRVTSERIGGVRRFRPTS